MKLTDISIRTRLIIISGMLLLLAVSLGLVSFIFVNRMWDQTRSMYEHPFTVTKAATTIKANVIEMQRLVRDMMVTEGKAEFLVDKVVFDRNRIAIEDNFKVIYEQFLGSKKDIDSTFVAYHKWLDLAEQYLEAKINAGYVSASKSDLLSLRNSTTTEAMLRNLDLLLDFANNMASTFYTNASNSRMQIRYYLVIMVCVLTLLVAIIVYLLTRSIRKPIYNLIGDTNQFRQGNYALRSQNTDPDEIGQLARAFNALAETIEKEITLKEYSTLISANLSLVNEMDSFAGVLLSDLIAQTNAQLAALYIVKEGTSVLTPYKSIGMDTEGMKSFALDSAEGEFGRAFALKKICVLEPSGASAFVHRTFAGSIIPASVVTIPLFELDKPIGAIALAFVKPVEQHHIKLLNEIHHVVAARLSAVEAYGRIVEMVDQLDGQNRELEHQSGELSLQADELKEYNIELEIQKKQLDETNRLKSAFLSNMSHELRTPLNSVIALAGVLSRKLKGKIDPDDYDYLGVIAKNGKSLLTLINEILDLSRIESGKVDLVFNRFSLNELVADLFQVLKPTADEKGITLTLLSGENLPMMTSDYTKVRHILQNLLANAVKFTEKGSVEAKLSFIGNRFVIAVKDTGIGIAPELLDVIFDEFRQADEKTSRMYGGSGLGLSIAKKYSELLEGRIEVETEPGKGSVFTLYLPSEIHHPDKQLTISELPDRQASGKQHAEVDAQGKTILIVEDSESQLIQLNDVLEPEGFNIITAKNGIEALKLVRQHLPDAMILDLMMPGMDGFELLKVIRSEVEAIFPVIVLTAKHVNREELNMLKGNNISQLVQKGALNRSELLNLVKGVFAKNQPADKAGGKARKTRKAGDPTILLIEDNPDNTLTIMALLGNEYFLLSAEDGTSGLEKARNFKPDLILLDISLPGLDGFEVLKGIRETESIKHTPVIAVTARAMKGDKEALLKAGFDAYIPKPVENELLESTINQLLYGK